MDAANERRLYVERRGISFHKLARNEIRKGPSLTGDGGAANEQYGKQRRKR